MDGQSDLTFCIVQNLIGISANGLQLGVVADF